MRKCVSDTWPSAIGSQRALGAPFMADADSVFKCDGGGARCIVVRRFLFAFLCANRALGLARKISSDAAGQEDDVVNASVVETSDRSSHRKPQRGADSTRMRDPCRLSSSGRREREGDVRNPLSLSLSLSFRAPSLPPPPIARPISPPAFEPRSEIVARFVS